MTYPSPFIAMCADLAVETWRFKEQECEVDTFNLSPEPVEIPEEPEPEPVRSAVSSFWDDIKRGVWPAKGSSR